MSPCPIGWSSRRCANTPRSTAARRTGTGSTTARSPMSGAGLLCFEATHVERDGRITQGCAGIYSDENEAALKPIVEWARGWMPHVKLGIQLGHAGRKASAQRPWKGGGALTQADAPDLPWTTFSASAIAYDNELAHAGGARCSRAQAREGGVSSRRWSAACGWASTWSSCTARTAICCTSSSRRSATSAATSMAARWKSAGAFRSRCSRPARGVAARQGAGRARLGDRLGRGRPHRRGHDRDRAPIEGPGLRLHRCQLGRQLTGSEDRHRSRLSGRPVGTRRARRPTSRPGRSASSPSRSRPRTSWPRVRPIAPRTPGRSWSTLVGPGTPPRPWARSCRRCLCRWRGPPRSCLQAAGALGQSSRIGAQCRAYCSQRTNS